MANGHSIIPIRKEDYDSLKGHLNEEMVYPPINLPEGRFPTLAELRQIIHDSGYKLEEAQDWYVTSATDFTEIWFPDDSKKEEHLPTEFWFRRGSVIVLDIVQKLANLCGSFYVCDHSGFVNVLILPNSVFDIDVNSQVDDGYISVMTQRLPSIIEQLDRASLDTLLFLLSQIRQTLLSVHEPWQVDYMLKAGQALQTYANFLKHKDVRIRYLAFDMIATLRYEFYKSAKVLAETIANEIDSGTKARMIWSIEHLIPGTLPHDRLDNSSKNIFEILLNIASNDDETLPVRFAAANLLVRAQTGFLTPIIKRLFIEALVEALVHPEQYVEDSDAEYSVSKDVLKSVEKLLLNHRFEIFQAVLPHMNFAQDAHEVLHALLDNTFYGGET